MSARHRRGFTLVELLVVIAIIGVMTAFAVPQYVSTLERNKADDAVALLNMVATANRMYALDHGNTYASGALTNACNTAACSATLTAPCNLVGCKYLAAQDFDGKPYTYTAASGGTCGTGMTGVACAARRTGAAPGTDKSPYNGWGYQADAGGAITIKASSGAPPPTQ